METYLYRGSRASGLPRGTGYARRTRVPDMKDEIPMILEQLLPVGGVPEPHGPDNCKNPNCPAWIKYDSIYHQDSTGVMFDIGNLLVWIPQETLTMDRDEQTIQMSLCEADRKGIL